MTKWSPSYNSQMTLSQQGYSDEVVAQVETHYLETYANHTDEDFLIVFAHAAKQLTCNTQVKDMAMIKNHWRPSPNIYQTLQDHHYSSEAIEQYRQEFIRWVQEER